MYIKRNEEKLIEERDKPEIQLENNFKELEYPEEKFIEKNSKDVRIHWRAPEFENYERDQKWYMYISAVLIAIVAYAVFTNSLVMAITFILIGIVGYIYIHNEPRELDFMITLDGVVAGREIYDFDNIKSFWIFYEEDDLRVISLHTGSYLVPYVHIPIHDQDPVEIRHILLEYLPEEEHQPGIVDTLDRLLRL